MATMTDNERTRMTDAAADWFVTNRADGRWSSEAERQRFTAWLEASPQHVEEYLAIARMAGDLTQAAQPDVPLDVLIARARADQEPASSPDTVVPFIAAARAARPRTGGSRWLPAALAAGLCAVAAGLGWWHFHGVAASGTAELPLTALRGEQLKHTMEDGSVLRLNTDTVARVKYSANRREVVLEHGQMLFEVRPDTARPFAVIAGTVEVVAVGTAFEVFLKDAVTQVTVTEGRVKVGAVEAGAGFEPVLVSAGEQLSVREDRLVSEPIKVDAARVTAWTRGRIALKDRPLSEVVAEFSRYRKRPIEMIASPEVARRPIGRVDFSIDDFADFLTYLRDIEALHVQIEPEHPDRVVVTSR